MKPLFTLALLLAAAFALTFALIFATGVITTDDIRQFLLAAAAVDPLYVAICVSLLLFMDIFIAMPTLTVTLLAGHLTGFLIGGMSAAAGMLAAGSIGYMLSRRYGSILLVRLYKNPSKIEEVQRIFADHGVAALILCRALPILPEVCCCLAGVYRMPFYKFLAGYGISTIPYAFVAAYAGSRSSPADPQPAIYTALGLSLALWLSWVVFIRKGGRKWVFKADSQGG